jgi:hypothetical protein
LLKAEFSAWANLLFIEEAFIEKKHKQFNSSHACYRLFHPLFMRRDTTNAIEIKI